MKLTGKQYLQINQALFSVVHAYEGRMAREAAPAQDGLTVFDCAVLMVLGQQSPANSRELARHMQVSASTVSIYIRRLRERGLVEVNQDSHDRRHWRLSLSSAGRATYRKIIQATVTYTQDFLATLSLDERRELHRLLLKVSHSLGFDWQ